MNRNAKESGERGGKKLDCIICAIHPTWKNKEPGIWQFLKEKNLNASVSALVEGRPQALCPLNTAVRTHFF